MVAVKSKLKIIAYRPEEQPTDMTSFLRNLSNVSNGVCAYLP